MGGGVDSTISSMYANSGINRTFVMLYDYMDRSYSWFFTTFNFLVEKRNWSHVYRTVNTSIFKELWTTSLLGKHLRCLYIVSGTVVSVAVLYSIVHGFESGLLTILTRPFFTLLVRPIRRVVLMRRYRNHIKTESRTQNRIMYSTIFFESWVVFLVWYSLRPPTVRSQY